MLLKYYTQYASKFEKLSSGHRTGKGQFLFQPQRRAVPKNVQSTTQFVLISHASKVMLKTLQARLQQYVKWELPDIQAGFRKAEEPEIKLPTSVGSSKKQENPEKHVFLLHWLCQSLWLCGSQQMGKFFKRWEFQTTLPASWEICMQVKKQQTWNNRLVPNWKRSTSRLYIVTLLI